jgi:hypothetical protein
MFQADSSAWPSRLGLHKINKPGLVTFNLPYARDGEGIVELAGGTFVATHSSGFTTTQDFVRSGGQISGHRINTKGFRADSVNEKILMEDARFETAARFDLMGGALVLREGAGFISNDTGFSPPDVVVHGDAAIRVATGAVFATGTGSVRKFSGDGDTPVLVEGGASLGYRLWTGEEGIRVNSGRIDIEGSGWLRLNDVHVVGPGQVRMATTGGVFVHEGITVSRTALEIGGGQWIPESTPGNALIVQGDVHWTGGTWLDNWKIADGSTGTILGQGDTRLTGVLHNHGTIHTVGPLQIVNPLFAGHGIVNAGVMRLESDNVFPFAVAGGKVDIRSTGKIEVVSGNAHLSVYRSRAIEGLPYTIDFHENRGRIVVSAGSMLVLEARDETRTVENFGEILVEEGGTVDMGYTTNFGRLSISGTLRGSVTNEGLLDVGDAIYSGNWLGKLTLGVAGTLVLDIESGDHFEYLTLW